MLYIRSSELTHLTTQIMCTSKLCQFAHLSVPGSHHTAVFMGLTFLVFYYFYREFYIYIELARWTQFRWSQFCWPYPKQHRSQVNICLFLSIRPDQIVDLGKVIELLHELFDLMLVGLYIHNEHSCIVVFYLIHDWLSS